MSNSCAYTGNDELIVNIRDSKSSSIVSDLCLENENVLCAGFCETKAWTLVVNIEYSSKFLAKQIMDRLFPYSQIHKLDLSIKLRLQVYGSTYITLTTEDIYFVENTRSVTRKDMEIEIKYAISKVLTIYASDMWKIAVEMAANDIRHMLVTEEDMLNVIMAVKSLRAIEAKVANV